MANVNQSEIASTSLQDIKQLFVSGITAQSEDEQQKSLSELGNEITNINYDNYLKLAGKDSDVLLASKLTPEEIQAASDILGTLQKDCTISDFFKFTTNNVQDFSDDMISKYALADKIFDVNANQTDEKFVLKEELINQDGSVNHNAILDAYYKHQSEGKTGADLKKLFEETRQENQELDNIVTEIEDAVQNDKEEKSAIDIVKNLLKRKNKEIKAYDILGSNTSFASVPTAAKAYANLLKIFDKSTYKKIQVRPEPVNEETLLTQLPEDTTNAFGLGYLNDKDKTGEVEQSKNENIAEEITNKAGEENNKTDLQKGQVEVSEIHTEQPVNDDLSLKNQEKTTKDEFYTQNEYSLEQINVAIDLSYAIVSVRAKNYVNSLQTQISAQQKLGKDVSALQSELDKAIAFSDVASNAVKAESESSRNIYRQALTNRSQSMVIDYNIEVKKDEIGNVLYDQNNMGYVNVISENQEQEDKICLDLAKLVVENNVEIYNPDGTLKNKSEIVELLDNYKISGLNGIGYGKLFNDTLNNTGLANKVTTNSSLDLQGANSLRELNTSGR